jgi:hypothetical protein
LEKLFSDSLSLRVSRNSKVFVCPLFAKCCFVAILFFIYSCAVSELDEAWELAIAEAERRARDVGRGDVADYLMLRASNDLARRAGVDWLTSVFMSVAGEANRAGASITIEQQDAHRFKVGNSTMVGTKLVFRFGLRALTIEAGWPRVPRDGIIRGNGLACGRIDHFGMKKHNEELLLVKQTNDAPQWFVIEEDTGTRSLLVEARVRLHVEKFLGQI